ncbi:MAG: hypothetical protein Q9213_007399 [Squamulea squamosa]
MAMIKAIEGRSVHQIQSGQVIIDLCSVAKELVENSLDAGATSIEVRFKGYGLESIEVQDNGNGISKENYETVALKHYTSKLSTYDDLCSLQTFGFRGEALSSLCALSNFQVVTAQAHEAPKGTRLDFETSGKLKATSVVASQKGTTVVVEALFANLPVRRRELEKNIKREYAKVLQVLQAYACISTLVKFSVSNILAKSKKNLVFATKSNVATRDNIANVFGARTLSALVSMNLRFSLQDTQSSKHPAGREASQVQVVGHVSRPVFGDGRQTPDRQLFFVNSRPCTLPQFAKVFNEVYKSYNSLQSPFVFANIIIDTNAYDVNVSPDKKTILLHEQTALLESLRGTLLELFENQDQTVPQAQRPQPKLPVFKPLTVQRQSSAPHDTHSAEKIENPTKQLPGYSDEGGDNDPSEDSGQEPPQNTGIIGRFAGRDAQARNRVVERDGTAAGRVTKTTGKEKLLRKLENSICMFAEEQDLDNKQIPAETDVTEVIQDCPPNPVNDFNKRIAEQQTLSASHDTRPSERSETLKGAEDDSVAAIGSTPPKPASGPVQNAFDRMRPRRESPQVATITIGEKATTTVIGSSPVSSISKNPYLSGSSKVRVSGEDELKGRFSSSMRAFAAPGAFLSDTASYEAPLTTNQNVHKDFTPLIQSPAASLGYAGQVPDNEDALSDTSLSNDEESIDSTPDRNASGAGESDEQYEDDEGRKAKQDAKVADLIQRAEAKLAAPSEDNLRRAGKVLKGRGLKDSTTQLLQTLHVSVSQIEEKMCKFEGDMRDSLEKPAHTRRPNQFEEEEEDAERKLTLKVSKDDFSQMDIVGQFNLGFILVTRPSTTSKTDDELFIIDQHASDEKYNFERLQASTTVQSQRLVRPKILDLTVIEEETIIENNATLLENGFIVDVDQSGDSPVGQRCRVLSLPMSREVTFDLSDLEELISLLGESPPSMGVTTTNNSGHESSPRYIPRPSKIRKLFAMRACRSSVMIGKTLQKRQMERLVRHMGEIDKPWNCPHGRPTMRHVIGLGAWEGWKEGDGVMTPGDEEKEEAGNLVDWGLWLAWKRNEEQEGRDDRHGDTSDYEEDEEGPSESDDDMHRTQGKSQTIGDEIMLSKDQQDFEGTHQRHDGIQIEENNESREESEDEDGWLTNTRQSISQRFSFS